jgi:PKD repeat protein
MLLMIGESRDERAKRELENMERLEGHDKKGGDEQPTKQGVYKKPTMLIVAVIGIAIILIILGIAISGSPKSTQPSTPIITPTPTPTVSPTSLPSVPKTSTMFDKPNFTFTYFPSSGPVPLRVTFSIQPYDPLTTYQWDFGDHGAATGQDRISHTYTEIGNYSVTLTGTNSNGQKIVRSSSKIVVFAPITTIKNL